PRPRRRPSQAGRHRPLPAQPGPQAARGRARPGGGWSMTSTAGHDLDPLLAVWAQTTRLAQPHRLPDADAERIRQTIVPQDLALPATWWSDFNSRVSEAIARATAMPAPAVAAWT